MTCFLWFGHEWEEKDRISLWHTTLGVRMGSSPYAYIFLLRCKKCGDLKKKKVSV